MNKMWIWIFLSLYSFALHAQEGTTTDSMRTHISMNPYAPHYWSGSREIGLNVTPLISRLVPFNLGSDQSGNIALSYRKYYEQRALRMNFGFNISESTTDEQNSFFFFSIGTEKRRDLSKKWYYTSGWDFIISADDATEEGVLAIGKSYGIEYHFSDRFFLGTYAYWYIGVAPDSGPVFKMEPPVAVFFNARIF